MSEGRRERMIGTYELLMILVVAAVITVVGGRGELELFLARLAAWLLSRPSGRPELSDEQRGPRV